MVTVKKLMINEEKFKSKFSPEFKSILQDYECHFSELTITDSKFVALDATDIETAFTFIHTECLPLFDSKILYNSPTKKIFYGLYQQKKVAVKYFTKLFFKYLTSGFFQKEAWVMGRLKSKYLAPLNAICVEEGRECLVTDYYQQSVESYLKEHNHISLWLILKWLLQITIGVMKIHAAAILHVDLKAANLVLSSHLNIKIIDYGSAWLMDPLSQTYNLYESTAIKIVNKSDHDFFLPRRV